MEISSVAISLFVLSCFAMGWMALRERILRLDGNLPYHVGSYQQDRRKGRFYFLSVWTGLGTAFAALACLELFVNIVLPAANTRNIISGAAYGLGLWGLLIIGLVWSQVGERVVQPNSDGKMLKPLPQESKNPESKK